MLSYNEVTPRKYIVLDDDIFEVLTSHVSRKQQRKPVNQTKLRNLTSGKVTERAFHQSETIEEAALETTPLTFIYARRGEATFSLPEDKTQRISVPVERVGETAGYLTEGMEVVALTRLPAQVGGNAEPLAERIISLKLPVKIEVEVVAAPPNIRGNTAQSGTKRVELAGGASVSVPLFIEAGDRIILNTETGEYVSRA